MTNSGVITINDHDGNIIHEYDPKNDESPYQIEHNKLFNSIRTGGQIDDTEYGAKATMTAIMGRMATYSGKVVKWDDAINDQNILVPENLTWNSEAPVNPDENGFYNIAVPGK